MYSWIISAGFAALFTMPSTAQAQSKVPAQEQSTNASSSVPIYIPPKRGAPVGRVGGGSRRPDVNLPTLFVLAPDHTGLTTKKQPTLYWFVSGPAKTQVKITVLDEEGIDPLLEMSLEEIMVGGIHKLPLVDYGITLQPNVEYQWFVSLVADPAKRSKDVVSGGTIRLVKPPAELIAALSDANRNREEFVYAENGIWYDALEALSRRIEQSPEDASLRSERAALLEQVELMEVAAFDRND